MRSLFASQGLSRVEYQGVSEAPQQTVYSTTRGNTVVLLFLR